MSDENNGKNGKNREDRKNGSSDHEPEPLTVDGVEDAPAEGEGVAEVAEEELFEHPEEADSTTDGHATVDAVLRPDGRAAATSAQELKDMEALFKDQERLHIERELKEAKELERLARERAKAARAKAKLREEAERHDEYVRSVADQLGMDPSRPVTPIPPLDEERQVQVELQPVVEGRSYIRIVYDKLDKRYEYEVIEPELLDLEREVLQFLRETLYRTLDGRHGVGEGVDWHDRLTRAAEQAIVDHRIMIDAVSKERVKYYLVRDFLGYGPIEVLMHDPMLEDISCDGPEVPIYVFHRQYGSVRSNVVFESDKQLDGFVIRLAQLSGKHISLAEPLLDATLPDTSRLQATLAREVTARGSSFTIRKFRSDPLTSPDLLRLGTMSAKMAAFFWLAMEYGQSIIYAGGTASGKTTSLNAVCQFIPPEKKVVSIEDTREINLRHENWIAGVSRPGYRDGGKGAGSGSIDMYRLLEAALRQRPEYLLVGEVRGVEAKTLFQAMATGHATYSTLHADSVMSAVYRLENPPISIPRIMLQTLDLVAIQVQAQVGKRMTRRVKELTEIVGIHPRSGDLITNCVFRWNVAKDKHEYQGSSHTLQKIMETRNMTHEEIEEEWDNRAYVLQWLSDRGIRHIDEVSAVLREYYRSPAEVLERLRAKAEEERLAGTNGHNGHHGLDAEALDALEDADVEDLDEDDLGGGDDGDDGHGADDDGDEGTEVDPIGAHSN